MVVSRRSNCDLVLARSARSCFVRAGDSARDESGEVFLEEPDGGGIVVEDIRLLRRSLNEIKPGCYVAMLTTELWVVHLGGGGDSITTHTSSHLEVFSTLMGRLLFQRNCMRNKEDERIISESLAGINSTTTFSSRTASKTRYGMSSTTVVSMIHQRATAISIGDFFWLQVSALAFRCALFRPFQRLSFSCPVRSSESAKQTAAHVIESVRGRKPLF